MSRQKFFITFILLLSFAYAKGQDEIITTLKDTISCKIISISLKDIKYEQEEYNGNKLSKSIPMDYVREYSFGVRSAGYIPTRYHKEVPAEPLQTPPKRNIPTQVYSPTPDREQPTRSFAPPAFKQPDNEIFDHWRIGFQGGGSYLLNSLHDLRQTMKDEGVTLPYQADNYYKNLRKGIYFNVDIHYMIKPSWGVGLRYYLLSSSVHQDYYVKGYTTVPSPPLPPDYYSDQIFNNQIPTYYCVNEKENFSLNYFGPSLLFQQWLDWDHKFRLNEELSVGYVFFRDKEQFDPDLYLFVNPITNSNQYNVLKEGKAFSGYFQLSLEYYPASWISIAVNGGISPAVFNSLKLSDNSTLSKQDVDGKIDMTHIDYSLGLRFHF